MPKLTSSDMWDMTDTVDRERSIKWQAIACNTAPSLFSQFDFHAPSKNGPVFHNSHISWPEIERLLKIGTENGLDNSSPQKNLNISNLLKIISQPGYLALVPEEAAKQAENSLYASLRTIITLCSPSELDLIPDDLFHKAISHPPDSFKLFFTSLSLEKRDALFNKIANPAHPENHKYAIEIAYMLPKYQLSMGRLWEGFVASKNILGCIACMAPLQKNGYDALTREQYCKQINAFINELSPSDPIQHTQLIVIHQHLLLVNITEILQSMPSSDIKMAISHAKDDLNLEHRLILNAMRLNREDVILEIGFDRCFEVLQSYENIGTVDVQKPRNFVQRVQRDEEAKNPEQKKPQAAAVKEAKVGANTNEPPTKGTTVDYKQQFSKVSQEPPSEAPPPKINKP